MSGCEVWPPGELAGEPPELALGHVTQLTEIELEPPRRHPTGFAAPKET